MQPGRRSRVGVGHAATLTAAVAAALTLVFYGGTLARAATAVSGAGGPAQPSITWVDSNGQSAAAPQSRADVPIRDAADSGDTSLEQTIGVSVLPGPLTVTPAAETVALTPGPEGTLAGTLPAVTVDDARGSLVGWRATVTVQSLNGVPEADLDRARLCVSPSPAVAVTGRPSEVRTARDACGSADDPFTLFFAPPNGGGGTFDDTARVTLTLPGSVSAGPVTATVAVTAR